MGVAVTMANLEEVYRLGRHFGRRQGDFHGSLFKRRHKPGINWFCIRPLNDSTIRSLPHASRRRRDTQAVFFLTAATAPGNRAFTFSLRPDAIQS
jgi:hypothetical protein